LHLQKLKIASAENVGADIIRPSPPQRTGGRRIRPQNKIGKIG